MRNFHDEEKAYSHFPLDLSEEELTALDQFSVEKHGYMDLVVELADLKSHVEKARAFLVDISKNDLPICNVIAELVFKIVAQVLLLVQQECAYIELRCSLPHTYFEIPRWHQDGNYFAPYTINQNILSKLPEFKDTIDAGAIEEFKAQFPVKKAAVTLKGPGTLFYNLPRERLKEFHAINDNREKAAEFLSDQSLKESTPTGYGSFFIVGASAGGIHSEPNITSPRFFMSVLPGSKKQTQETETRNRLTRKLTQERRPSAEISTACGEHIAKCAQSYLEENRTQFVRK